MPFFKCRDCKDNTSCAAGLKICRIQLSRDELRLTSPPLDGRANQACIEFFAKFLKVPRSSVTIASGQTSRQKMIRVSGLSAEEVRKRIANAATGSHS